MVSNRIWQNNTLKATDDLNHLGKYICWPDSRILQRPLIEATEYTHYFNHVLL